MVHLDAVSHLIGPVSHILPAVGIQLRATEYNLQNSSMKKAHCKTIFVNENIKRENKKIENTYLTDRIIMIIHFEAMDVDYQSLTKTAL